MAILRGTDGNDVLTGTDERDHLYGLGGADVLEGGKGPDFLYGGPGADTLRGGEGSDRASYDHSAAGVTVNLATGKGKGGDAEGDTLESIESVFGSRYTDRLIGGDGNDTLYGGNDLDVLYGGDGNDWLNGGKGADRLDGGTGSDWARYTWPYFQQGVTVDLGANTASGSDADGDTFTSIENLQGSIYADHLTGDSNDNVLVGFWGADVLNGGAGEDSAWYDNTSGSVTVNLETNTGKGGAAEGDTFISIENLRGGYENDTLIGDANANELEGWYGADRLDGGGGSDTASYADSAGGVTVDLTKTGAQQTANNHDAAGDRLTSIENLRGSAHDDTLIGDANANVLEGGAGDDTLIGGGGADTLDGGEGEDTATYAGASAGVTASLGTSPGSGGIRYISIEHFRGSRHADRLTGDGKANELEGGAGADVLDGGGGSD